LKIVAIYITIPAGLIAKSATSWFSTRQNLAGMFYRNKR